MLQVLEYKLSQVFDFMCRLVKSEIYASQVAKHRDKYHLDSRLNLTPK